MALAHFCKPLKPIKTISFDLPCVHKFGIQHLKTAFFEKITKENSSRARQAELVVEQLKSKHLVVHIPHNLALNRNVSIPTNVPLFDYLEKGNFVRKSSTFYSFHRPLLEQKRTESVSSWSSALENSYFWIFFNFRLFLHIILNKFRLTIVSKDASLASELVELVFSTEFEGFIFRGSSRESEKSSTFLYKI
jgi:hypothetical protein